MQTSEASPCLANVERFTGFSDLYDSARPRAPQIIVNLLTQLSQKERLAQVVDLGSGTGLSTLLWTDKAESVIGIEPNHEMRAHAECRARSGGTHNVFFKSGYSNETGLGSESTDIVTVSQALHWMEPKSTFKEVARILKPGGIFMAYDCDWPPTVHPECEAAWDECFEAAEPLEVENRIVVDLKYWNKSDHLQRMRESGVFRFTREITFHHLEEGSADRLVRLLLSQGGIANLIKRGVSEDQIGITRLREVCQQVLGDARVPFYWSYRARLGVK